MSYQIQCGKTFTATLDLPQYVNVLTDPLAPGYPKTELLDVDKTLIQAVAATPGFPPTQYESGLTVPQNIEIDGVDYVTLQIKWTIKCTTGKEYTVYQELRVIEPESTTPLQQEVVTINSQMQVSIIIDNNLNPATDTALITVYRNNVVWQHDSISSPAQNVAATAIVPRGETTMVTFDLTSYQIPARLDGYEALITGTIDGNQYVRFVRLFVVTPSVLGAASELEHMLKKSRAHNVIASLNYTQANIMLYLSRGLAWFNGYSPTLTSFNGMNMQGMLRNAWVICSMYYALMAQALAENDLAFDFSGQSVTLRVDRTAGIDSALGRIESELDRTIKPLKMLLGKSGVTGGDGSIGASDGGGAALGSGLALGTIMTGNHSMLNLNFGIGKWPWNVNLAPIR